MSRPVVILLAAVLALSAGVAVAGAAPRQVPRGWLGVMADGPLNDPSATNRGEWDLMASSGAESVRVAVSWALAQPIRGGALELASVDASVLAAARRGIGVLLVVVKTPGWAAIEPLNGPGSPPRRLADYGAFLRALVARYGPGGRLWARHPRVRAQPVRTWQIWNEPNLVPYWWDPPSGQDFATSYVRLLRAARHALLAADPGARIILAGLPNDSWTALDALYRAGARGLFDAVALHPFTSSPSNVLRIVKLARGVMRSHHDPSTPIWITEMTFPASMGHVPDGSGFTTTEGGQATRLRETLMMLARRRRSLRIQHVYWYTWLSLEQAPDVFRWSGLRRLRDGRAVSVPSLSAFRSVARRLEGCAKRPGDARRCR